MRHDNESNQVTIEIDRSIQLEGNLQIPRGARGIVMFAHGSGSGRHSPRNRYVARMLQEGGFATLLMDLLTAEEEALDLQTADLRFDIPLLARRVAAATRWLSRHPATVDLQVGYFGASTGAAAALVAAAEMQEMVAAVVSRGGRPDLAGAALPRVQAPTLLIVGGDDPVVIEMNRDAMIYLRCEKKLEIVPRASHLFEENGALETVAGLARQWFDQHLSGNRVSRAA